VFLLKRGWVDCEGWDLLSLRHGRPGGAKLYREKTPGAEGGEESPEERGEDRGAALELLRGYLAEGDAEAALAAYSGAVAESGPWSLAEHDLRELIQALKKARAWAAAKPLVLEYIRRFPGKSEAMKLLLAGIYLDLEKRPAKAAEALGSIAAGRLPESLERARRGLLAKAERLRREGALEVDLGD
jgi:hypothetical protein